MVNIILHSLVRPALHYGVWPRKNHLYCIYTQGQICYFDATDPNEWSLVGFLKWRLQLPDFSNKKMEHGTFSYLVKTIANRDGRNRKEAQKLLQNLKVTIAHFMLFTLNSVDRPRGVRFRSLLRTHCQPGVAHSDNLELVAVSW